MYVQQTQPVYTNKNQIKPIEKISVYMNFLKDNSNGRKIK